MTRPSPSGRSSRKRRSTHSPLSTTHQLAHAKRAASVSETALAGGQGRGRTADLSIFSRSLVPTELPGRARLRRSGANITGPPRARENGNAPEVPYAVGALSRQRRPPSSSGLGPRPFTAVAPVRIRLGVRCRRRLGEGSGRALEFHRSHREQPGPVAQLVSAPPCHGGGRGFESRRGRRAETGSDQQSTLCQSPFPLAAGSVRRRPRPVCVPAPRLGSRRTVAALTRRSLVTPPVSPGSACSDRDCLVACRVSASGGNFSPSRAG